MQADEIYKLIREVLGKYQRTLPSDRKHLVEYFTLVQLARKVVGVGSVGTRAWIALMEAETGPNRCSCRPRRPSRPCSPPTAGAASTATRGSGSSPVSS